MKKHLVDDLFKKRLASFEKKPSESAWDRIQQGQNSKSRRLGAWVWYVAASVTLALVSGYVVWQNEAEKALKEQHPTELAGLKMSNPDTTSDSGPGEKQAVAVAERPVVEEKPVMEPAKETRRAEAEKKETRKKNVNGVPETGVIRVEVYAPAQVAKTETAKPEPVKSEAQSLSPEKDPSRDIELARQEDKAPDRTIVVDIDEPKNEFKDKKPSRLARVFRQLQNVREAEPVDWDDVGFNPKNIVARADDRPNDHDEKGSGKRERKN
jgi:hypothetical protein